MKKYMVTSIIILWLSICYAAIGHADNARKERTVHFGVMGSIIGSGGFFGLQIFEMIYLGGNFTSFAYDEKNSDETELIELDLSTQTALLRIYPISDWSFFFQGGYVSRDWKIQGWSYDSNDDGTIHPDEWVKATLTFPKSASMVGLGFEWIADWGLTFSLGINAIIGDAPEVEIESGSDAVQEDIDREEENLEKEAEGLETIPQVYLSLGYAF